MTRNAVTGVEPRCCSPCRGHRRAWRRPDGGQAAPSQVCFLSRGFQPPRAAASKSLLHRHPRWILRSCCAARELVPGPHVATAGGGAGGAAGRSLDGRRTASPADGHAAASAGSKRMSSGESGAASAEHIIVVLFLPFGPGVRISFSSLSPPTDTFQPSPFSFPSPHALSHPKIKSSETTKL